MPVAKSEVGPVDHLPHRGGGVLSEDMDGVLEDKNGE